MDSTNSSSKDHTKPVMRKRCKYQVRWFYSKGAFLVLLWTTLISATLWSYITNLGQKFLKKSYGEHWYIVLIPLSSLTFIVIPLLGWLADAKLGNYRVFKLSCFFFTNCHNHLRHSYSLRSHTKVNCIAVHKCCRFSTSRCSRYSRCSSFHNDSLTAWSRSNARCFFH